MVFSARAEPAACRDVGHDNGQEGDNKFMATFIQVAVKNAKPLIINADNIEYIIDHADGSAHIYFSSDNSVIVQVKGAEIAKLAENPIWE